MKLKLVPFEVIDLDKLDRGYFYVYALAEPESATIRYIGRSYDLYKRVQFHVTDALRLKGGGPPVSRWIYGLHKEGREPNMLIVCRCGCLMENKLMERFWIRAYLRAGYNLLNGVVRKDEPRIDAYLDQCDEIMEAYDALLAEFYQTQLERIATLYHEVLGSNDHLR